VALDRSYSKHREPPANENRTTRLRVVFSSPPAGAGQPGSNSSGQDRNTGSKRTGIATVVNSDLRGPAGRLLSRPPCTVTGCHAVCLVSVQRARLRAALQLWWECARGGRGARARRREGTGPCGTRLRQGAAAGWRREWGRPAAAGGRAGSLRACLMCVPCQTWPTSQAEASHGLVP
jgi:hypothetical protein